MNKKYKTRSICIEEFAYISYLCKNFKAMKKKIKHFLFHETF